MTCCSFCTSFMHSMLLSVPTAAPTCGESETNSLLCRYGLSSGCVPKMDMRWSSEIWDEDVLWAQRNLWSARQWRSSRVAPSRPRVPRCQMSDAYRFTATVPKMGAYVPDSGTPPPFPTGSEL